MTINFKILLLFLLFNIHKDYVEGSLAADRDLSLKSNEKIALDKFKETMDPFLQTERQRSEVYLIRWLRATNFDVKKAEDMLLKDIRWREDVKLDKIHDEDWYDFSLEYEYQLDTLDKEFQPVLTTQMGTWDFRQAILSGHRGKMMRYIFKMLDEIDSAIIKQQEQGKFVTRGNILVDLNGYNLSQHGCLQCISLYIEMVLALDSHFPGLYDKMILVNVPSTFETVLNILKPVMAPGTRKALQVYGTNRQRWQKYLLSLIDEDQLPPEFGGNKLY